MESKAQQVLLHNLFWENIAPVFKTECQEAYHFFTVTSPNNYCDSLGLFKGFKFARWPNDFRRQLDI